MVLLSSKKPLLSLTVILVIWILYCFYCPDFTFPFFDFILIQRFMALMCRWETARFETCRRNAHSFLLLRPLVSRWINQVATVMAETARVAAAAQIDSAYSPGGDNVHRMSHVSLPPIRHLDRFGRSVGLTIIHDQQTDRQTRRSRYVAMSVDTADV